MTAYLVCVVWKPQSDCCLLFDLTNDVLFDRMRHNKVNIKSQFMKTLKGEHVFNNTYLQNNVNILLEYERKYKRMKLM